VPDLTEESKENTPAKQAPPKEEETKSETKSTPVKQESPENEAKEASPVKEDTPVKESPAKESPAKESPAKETPVKSEAKDTPVKSEVKATPVKSEATPVKEEVKSESLKTSEEAASKDVKSPPSEIKESYIQDKSAKKRPNLVGIQGFKNDPTQANLDDSPMRRKKKHLGQLNLKESIQEVKPDEEKKKERLEKLEDQFKVVLTNFTQYQKSFEDLKSKTVVDLAELNKTHPLQDTEKEWQVGLEMNMAKDEHSDADLVEFNQMKHAELKEIESFIHIVHDWIDESLMEIDLLPPLNLPKYKADEEPPKKAGISRQQSSVMVETESKTQARLQAQMQA